MKQILFVSFLLIMCSRMYSQTDSEQAKTTYLEAAALFEQAKYQEAIDKLVNVKKLLGATNIRIQYLMVKSYYYLNNYEQTQIEIESFLSFNPPHNESYIEIEKISTEVNGFLRQRESAMKLEKMEEEEWQSACKSNSIESYNRYIEQFPTGKYSAEAKNRLAPLELEINKRIFPSIYLKYAIRENDYDEMLHLIEIGAESNVFEEEKNEYGIFYASALSKIAGYSFLNGSVEDKKIQFNRIKFLLEHGANPNTIDCKMYGVNGETIIGYAIMDFFQNNTEFMDENMKYDMIKLLIDYGLNQNVGYHLLVNLTNYHNKPYSSKSAIVLLLEGGVDPYGGKHSPNFYAKKDGNYDLVELFKKYKKNKR